MKNLKSEFLAAIGNQREINKLENNIKKASYNITAQKIKRLKSSQNKSERVAELIKNYIIILQNENINNINTISSAIEGSMKALSKSSEESIYKKISMLTKLKQEIEEEKYELKKSLQDVYRKIELFSNTLDNETSSFTEMAIKDTKLKDIMLLGILKETTEEAIISALEDKKNIQEIVETIIQNILLQTIDENDFSKDKILEASKTIIEVSVNIADENQAYAKDILQGATRGIKNAIVNAVNELNKNIEFLPEEIRSQKEEKILFEGLNIIDLNDDFIKLLKDASQSSNGISKEILNEIIIKLNSSVTRLLQITSDTKESILKKVEKLKDSPKVNEFRDLLGKKIKTIKKEDIEQVAKESKKLGLRAWEIAKNAIDNALKSKPDDKDKEGK